MISLMEFGIRAVPPCEDCYPNGQCSMNCSKATHPPKAAAQAPEKPVRLQLSRAKGFNLQAESLAVNGLTAVNVARPSKWGNPTKVHTPKCKCRSKDDCFCYTVTAADAVAMYRVITLPARLHFKKLDLAEIKGKNLACWCKPGMPCHADVLLELANAPDVATGEAAG